MQLVEAFKNQKTLHRKYALKILQLLGEFLPTLPTLTDVPIAPGGKITVCGDTHGQFYDLRNIFEINVRIVTQCQRNTVPAEQTYVHNKHLGMTWHNGSQSIVVCRSVSLSV